MTARIVVSCDGTWDEGRMPCRGAYPCSDDNPDTAPDEAAAHGWRIAPYAVLDDLGDLCPAHVRIHSPVHNEGTP